MAKSLLAPFVQSKRLPNLAGKPRGVSGLGMYGEGPLTRELDATAMPTVYQTVGTLANATAAAPWTLYRKRAPRADPLSVRQVVSRHPALSVTQRPNPFYTWQSLLESVQQHIDLTGEGYFLVVRREPWPWPTQLWPILPTRMIPVVNGTDFLSGWVYQSPDGQRVPLRIDEVIQIKLPNPRDPHRGLGPVQSILLDTEAAKFSALYARNFFINDATPGGVIEVPESLDPDSFDQLQQSWGESHRGASRAHTVAILDNGATWKPGSVSMRDMQFTDLRKQAREIVLEAFGMPKTMLGGTEQVNRATAEAAIMVFRRDKVKPRLERIKDALNHQYLPMFFSSPDQVNVEYDFDPQIPEDATAKAAELRSRTEGARTLIETGFLPEDALKVVGLPDMHFEGRQNAAAPTGAAPGDPDPGTAGDPPSD